MRKITLVAGSPGAGKTNWIRQHVSRLDRAAYLNLGSGAVPVDGTYLASELPQLTVLSEEQLALLQEPTFVEYPIYIELGFHLDLKSLVFPVRIGNYCRVAVISPDADASEWHDWADTIVSGANAKVNLAVPHLWRSVLTGEVLDWASLQTFWYELIHGAYGKVRRAKGIFDVADGRSLSFNFVAGLAESDSIELDLPLWSVGRPDRFSGIELVGEQLDERAISETLQDCCLDDAAIAYYQQQIQAFLVEEEEGAR